MPLFRLLFLLVLLLPLIEIYCLVKVGGAIGAIPTVALVVFSAVFGALLIRYQGLATANRVRAMMARGELPTVAMLEGVVLLLSGVLLMIPGFVTDLLGLIGLIPPLRQALVWALLRRGMLITPVPRPTSSPPPSPHRKGPTTIEGDYTREDR